MPRKVNHDDLLLRVLKDLNDVRSALKRVVATLPLFDIANENTPSQITADQNNYNPGNYDILRLSSDAQRNITGITHGLKGRFLQLFNIGSFPIVLVHASLLSTAANRFNFATNVNNVILPGSSIKIYYDDSQQRWIEGTQLEASGIFKESTPSQITSNQNNYDSSDYDVLRLSTDAPRTITGFSGGVQGRTLRIFNVGNYEITISHESASSSAANRVISPTGFDIIVNADGEIELYYDFTQQRWIASYSSNANRISAEVRLTGNYSVNDATYTGVIWDDEITDTGNFWDASQPLYFTMPETGWYHLECAIIFDANASGFREVQMYEATLVKPLIWTTQEAINGGQTLFNLSTVFYAPAGEQWGVEVWQNSGGALNVIRRRTFSTTFLNSRMRIVKL